MTLFLQNDKPSFTSCCVHVDNIKRTSYILPREKLLNADGEETETPVDMIKHVFPEFAAIARQKGESVSATPDRTTFSRLDMICAQCAFFLSCACVRVRVRMCVCFRLSLHCAVRVCRHQEPPREARQALLHVPLPGSSSTRTQRLPENLLLCGAPCPPVGPCWWALLAFFPICKLTNKLLSLDMAGA